jgi:hypothetical protein
MLHNMDAHPPMSTHSISYTRTHIVTHPPATHHIPTATHPSHDQTPLLTRSLNTLQTKSTLRLSQGRRTSTASISKTRRMSTARLSQDRRTSTSIPEVVPQVRRASLSQGRRASMRRVSVTDLNAEQWLGTSLSQHHIALHSTAQHNTASHRIAQHGGSIFKMEAAHT